MDIEKVKEQPVVQAVTYFKGHIKKMFLEDVQRGEKPADLLRQMAKCYYEQKESRAKHSY